MSPERWARLQALFHRAEELPAAERPELVAAECPDDPELARQVLTLLGGAAESAVLAGPIGELAGELDLEAWSPGDRVGPYRIVSELGRGGMGTVYLAERADDAFDQQVALKIVRGVVASPPAVARFLAERRILARLEHPNIARLLDGGTTEHGSPYFVMERVEGEPITAWCDRRRLGARERIELFLTVCGAVQHAHGNLVVHRDLKPSNLLVTPDGTPKLLDFGIAKLLDPEADAQGLTRLGELPMTPEYASPEQVRGEPVSVSSDVYALGLLLYELLTGRRAQRVAAPERREIERAVCEVPATRPSAAVTRPRDSSGPEEGASPAEVAAARRTTPAGLRRRLRGDLDTIVLAALRKEPERRYPSADALAGDLRRHLLGLPVEARGDPFGYRAWKFVRRHAAGVAATAGMLLLTVALVGFYTFRLARARDRAETSARSARLEAEKSAQVTEFLVSLLEESDPDRAQGREVTVHEVLDRSARKVDRELADQPGVQATMHTLLGRVYDQLGLLEEAEEHLAAALGLRRRTLGSEHPRVAETAERLALVLLERGRWDEAESLARESLDIRRRVLGERHPDLVGSLVALARVSYERGRTDEGRKLLQRAFSLLDDDTAPSRRRLADTLEAAALIELGAGDPKRAEELARREIEIRDGFEPSRTEALAQALHTLAYVLSQRSGPERLQEAERALSRGIEIERSLLGDEDPRVAFDLADLASVRARAGDFAGGETTFLQARDLALAALGPDHPEVAKLLNNIAVFYYRQGKWSRAIDYYTRSLDLRLRVLGPGHPLIGTTRAFLGLALHRAGDPAAEATYRQALAELIESRGARHEKVGNLRADLGTLLAEQGRYAEAERQLRQALEIVRPVFGDDDPRSDGARAGLGFALCGLGRPDEGEPLLATSRAWREERYPEGHRRRVEVRLYLAECATRRGKGEEAARRIATELAALRQDRPDDEVLIRLARRLEAEARRRVSWRRTGGARGTGEAEERESS